MVTVQKENLLTAGHGVFKKTFFNWQTSRCQLWQQLILFSVFICIQQDFFQDSAVISSLQVCYFSHQSVLNSERVHWLTLLSLSQSHTQEIHFNVLIRRATGFHMCAKHFELNFFYIIFLFIFELLYKKSIPLPGETRQANSSSQLVNFYIYIY